MVSVFNNKEDCCGCSACCCICPVSAISMVPDSEGFLYPLINKELCIECNRCQEVCSFNNANHIVVDDTVRDYYAIKSKNEIDRSNSQSGGFFSVLYKKALLQSSVIYGAGFSESLEVVHKRALTENECFDFHGSKYVQSKMNNIFKTVKDDLNSGTSVLFSGTPCQVGGLKNYILKNRIDDQKLFLCDFICHGVPSPTIFSDYKNYILKKNRGKVLTLFNFRDKKFGWKSITETFIIDGKIGSSSEYNLLFYSHNILRPSCHVCKYAQIGRISDITFADCWGIEDIEKGFADNKGVSLALINTHKGKFFFDSCKNDMFFIKILPKGLRQPALYAPSKPNIKRDQFWRDYYKKGFEYILSKYINNIPRILKQQIKKIIKGNL